MSAFTESFTDYLHAHTPLISVIVTSFNKAPFLEECLSSIIHQSYRHKEILVVNDGSSDETSDVVRRIIQAHPSTQITLLEKANGGVSDARNYGIRRAQGRAIVMIDGDDKIMPHYLERAVSSLKSSGGDIFRPNQQNFGNSSGQWQPHPYDRYSIRYDNCIPTPSLYDRRLFELAGGFKTCLSFCEDWEFWVNCSRFRPLVTESQEFLTCWRDTDTGLHAEGVSGRWQEAFSSIAILNQDCYSVSEVLAAHNNVPDFAPSHLKSFEKLNLLHPKEWFLKFVSGLIAERNGEITHAIDHYCTAQELCSAQEWQPYFRLGVICESAQKYNEAFAFLHETRIRRPDMGPVVQGALQRIASRTP